MMPKKIHLAIVDDESIQIDSMNSLISQSAEELGLTVKISRYSSGEAFLFDLEENLDLDIVFLDIEMKQINGLDTAKKIRETDQNVTIVFATAFAEYAVQGYEVQALDYLLKPIEVNKVKKVLTRHMGKVPLEKEIITVEVFGDLIKVDLKEICFIEVIKRECHIHLENDVLVIHTTLKELSDQLTEAFIQTHRSYLVNLEHVNRLIKTDVELSNGKIVPVSRRLTKRVQEKFIAFNKGTVFYDD